MKSTKRTLTFIWPCLHGGVLIEQSIPPHHKCAVCGAEPIQLTPEQAAMPEAE